MSPTFNIEGQCGERFAAVREAFMANFEEHAEVGAAFAVVHKGELVVDLWGGHADAAGTRLWRPDTVSNVWSTTKGVAAICFALLVERGMVNYDDRVATFWPEFAAHGKGEITVAQLLSHQAGLCGFREPVTMQDIADQTKAEQLLADQAPYWQPGTRSGYHAVTYGPLVNALFRRIEGRTLAQFLEEELARPYGLEISVGLPEAEAGRASELVAPPNLSSPDANPVPSPEQQAALANPVLDPLDANTAAWRQAQIPSVNGFATAKALARLYGMMTDGTLNGDRLISPETLAMASAVRIEGEDLVLGLEVKWAAGFLRNIHNVYGDSDAAFGHSGWGGSLAYADPGRKLGVAYVMNAMGPNLVGDPRGLSLIEATVASLKAS